MLPLTDISNLYVETFISSETKSLHIIQEFLIILDRMLHFLSFLASYEIQITFLGDNLGTYLLIIWSLANEIYLCHFYSVLEQISIQFTSKPALCCTLQ